MASEEGGLTSDCDSEVAVTAAKLRQAEVRLEYLKENLEVKKASPKRRGRKKKAANSGSSVTSESAMETDGMLESRVNKRKSGEVKSPTAEMATKKVASCSSLPVSEAEMHVFPKPSTSSAVSPVKIPSVPSPIVPSPVVPAVVPSPVVVPSGDVSSVRPSEKKPKKGKGPGAIEEFGLVEIKKKLAVIKNEVIGVMAEFPAAGAPVARAMAGYEEIILMLSGANERLRGRLDVSGGSVGVNAPQAVPSGKGSVVSLGVPMGIKVAERPSFKQIDGMARVSAGVVEKVRVMPAPPAAKPVETWSLVVKGKKNETVSEVRKRVEDEILPAAGVRVHAVIPTKNGGVIVKTPSLAERDRIVSHRKLGEVGLQAETSLGKRLVVLGVEKRISPLDFAHDLRRLNLDDMAEADFAKQVRVVNPWAVGDGKLTVVLSCTAGIAEKLTANGRCYIKHFSFVVREDSLVRHCFRCLGLDHVAAQCRQSGLVCKRCGQTGHSYRSCGNGIHCRDCDFRGNPAGHFMLTADCPVWAEAAAKAGARH